MRCLMVVGLLCIGLAFVPSAQATAVTIDFESGPPIGTAINDDYKVTDFTFWQQSDSGFRPYRRTAGVATHSGTVAADVSHCDGETENAIDCEFPVPSTEGRLTRTASAVTVYAG